MKIEIIPQIKSDNLIIFFDNTKKILVNESLEKLPSEIISQISDFLQLPEVKNEVPETYLFYTSKIQRVILAGLGKSEKKQDTFRKLGGKIAQRIQQLKISAIDLILPENLLYESGDILLESILLGSYQFEEYKTQEQEKNPAIKSLMINIATEPIEALTSKLEKANIIAESVNMIRDVANQPANFLTPTQIKIIAEKIAQENQLHFESLDVNEMENLGFGCLLGVAQGSAEPPYLHILEYQAPQANAETLMLVGKGITFDAGGISLKPPTGMEEMKFDMSGAAAVLGAMRIIGILKPQINVIGLLPCAENLPDGKAIKPGDILKSFSGKTVEIISTDAEGRLILADALAYGVKRYQPTAVIDVATLTGACLIALGHNYTALLTNNEKLGQQIKNAADKTDDKVWELPLVKEYQNQLESNYADLKNCGAARDAGTITGALFIQNFIGETPWAHLDIAGTSLGIQKVDYLSSKVATGAGCRLLADLALNWQVLK